MHQYAPVTIEFQAPCEYDNPLREPEVGVVFTAPSGRQRCVWAFWDGGTRWLARTEASETGTWKWRVEGPDAFDPAEGTFTVSEYEGDNPLYRHGPICVGGDGFRLTHADGTPFFWLADTAWNGLLRARPEEWDLYLRTRVAQGMTATQCVMTQWRAMEGTDRESMAYFGKSDVRINPTFYQRIDPLLERANRAGLVVAPVVMWACTPPDPGNSLPEDDRRAVSRYIVSRYGACSVVWLLGGDAQYKEDNAEGWRRLGRDLFGDGEERLVTMHVGGERWDVDQFRDEPWYDIATWQSGHGDSEKSVAWLTRGPHVDAWRTGRPMPFIDLEPRYEDHAGYSTKVPHNAHAVRRGLWWNLLMKPTCGVTYGQHGVWPWAEQRGDAPGHAGLNPTRTWREGLESEASAQLIHIRKFFDDAPWHELMPAPELLAEQPGDADAEQTIAVARHKDGGLVVAYLPHGGKVVFQSDGLPSGARAEWFDPQTGETREAEGDTVFEAPDVMDWVLVVKVL